MEIVVIAKKINVQEGDYLCSAQIYFCDEK